MVPYSVVPYFGPLSNFNGTGAGTGDWLKIYLCNGQNGTPDLRGRTLVGTTTGMFGGPLAPAVDFNIPGSGNPNYTLGSVVGANQVTLGVTQIPSHTHVATAVVTDPGHTHNLKVNTNAAGSGFPAFEAASSLGNFATDSAQTNITVAVSNAPIGGGLGHTNIQPSIGSYFIIYLP